MKPLLLLAFTLAAVFALRGMPAAKRAETIVPVHGAFADGSSWSTRRPKPPIDGDDAGQSSDLERQLATTPAIEVPSITIGSDFDGPASIHRTLRGMAHNVPQEDPRSFTEALVDADTL